MFLTDEENEYSTELKARGKQKAMEMLYALGVTFDAEKLIPIKRAHVALSGQEGDTYWCEPWSQEALHALSRPRPTLTGTRTTLRNSMTSQKRNSDLANRTGEAYRKIGAILTYHCAPGVCSNVPFYGEHIAFSESSATPYVNGALYTRSNRESSIARWPRQWSERLPITDITSTKTDTETSSSKWMPILKNRTTGECSDTASER